ncbi:MAG: M14 family metallopeptidase [Myxococcota bacterium]
MPALSLLTLLPLAAAVLQPALTTTAEQTGFLRTGRYDETVQLCHAFQKAHPSSVRCITFGTTPEGRPMVALVASGDGTLDAAANRRKGRPVILFQGGIHAGEIDGKDAGFMLMRDVLAGKAAPGVLQKATLVFVPVFNVDGHERFGAHNRPNQVGPAEMGWRTTSHNLNLNRDYAKAEAPEMAAMLRLLEAWDPILYLDLHVTDGAKFQHDVAVMLAPRLTGPEPLRKLGDEISNAVLKKLTARKHLPLDFYPAFEKDDDPTSGFAVGVPPPRFQTVYWAMRNRFAVLVETHSWKDYAARVRATYDTVLSFLELAVDGAASWQKTALSVDTADLKLPGTAVPLAFKNTAKQQTFPFQGYKYVREPSAISGAMRITYDETKPEVWNVPYWPEVEPALTVQAPSGYVVPPGHAAWMGEKLRLHGFKFDVVKNPRVVDVEVFRVAEQKFGTQPYEGRMTVQARGAWSSEKREIPAGSLYVPTGQRGGALLVHLMEPGAPDSFFSWGFFNGCMEQKEYMEAYVAEDVAREMLARDPKLKAEFERKLETEPEFAKDPAARLRFFYQRHPSWDVRLGVYPIYRVSTAP